MTVTDQRTKIKCPSRDSSVYLFKHKINVSFQVIRGKEQVLGQLVHHLEEKKKLDGYVINKQRNRLGKKLSQGISFLATLPSLASAPHL